MAGILLGIGRMFQGVCFNLTRTRKTTSGCCPCRSCKRGAVYTSESLFSEWARLDYFLRDRRSSAPTPGGCLTSIPLKWKWNALVLFGALAFALETFLLTGSEAGTFSAAHVVERLETLDKFYIRPEDYFCAATPESRNASATVPPTSLLCPPWDKTGSTMLKMPVPPSSFVPYSELNTVSKISNRLMPFFFAMQIGWAAISWTLFLFVATVSAALSEKTKRTEHRMVQVLRTMEELMTTNDDEAEAAATEQGTSIRAHRVGVFLHRVLFNRTFN